MQKQMTQIKILNYQKVAEKTRYFAHNQKHSSFKSTNNFFRLQLISQQQIIDLKENCR